jgi:hypothetical protein
MLWLASNDASFVTGEILTIDGGQSLTTDNYGDYLRLLQAQRNAGEGLAGQLLGGFTAK